MVRGKKEYFCGSSTTYTPEDWKRNNEHFSVEMQKWKIIAKFLSNDTNIVLLISLQSLTFTKWKISLISLLIFKAPETFFLGWVNVQHKGVLSYNTMVFLGPCLFLISWPLYIFLFLAPVDFWFLGPCLFLISWPLSIFDFLAPVYFWFLGPCLFLISINDMPDNIHSNIRLFADDTIMYLTVSNQSECQALQTDLTYLEKWENEWLMSLNPDKREVWRITKKKKENLATWLRLSAFLNHASTCNFLLENDAGWRSGLCFIFQKTLPVRNLSMDGYFVRIGIKNYQMSPFQLTWAEGSQGELIVYQWSVVRPSSSSLSVVHTFKLEYLWRHLANLDQILFIASLGWGKGCIRFWVRLDQNSGCHGNRKPALTYIGENSVSTFSRIVFDSILSILAGIEDMHKISD